jgi:hypothetical protein
VGQVVEIPALKLQRPVRSMQMFRKPVQVASAGDRVGVCLAQLDPSLLERGLLAAPGTPPGPWWARRGCCQPASPRLRVGGRCSCSATERY